MMNELEGDPEDTRLYEDNTSHHPERIVNLLSGLKSRYIMKIGRSLIPLSEVMSGLITYRRHVAKGEFSRKIFNDMISDASQILSSIGDRKASAFTTLEDYQKTVAGAVGIIIGGVVYYFGRDALASVYTGALATLGTLYVNASTIKQQRELSPDEIKKLNTIDSVFSFARGVIGDNEK